MFAEVLRGNYRKFVCGAAFAGCPPRQTTKLWSIFNAFEKSRPVGWHVNRGTGSRIRFLMGKLGSADGGCGRLVRGEIVSSEHAAACQVSCRQLTAAETLHLLGVGFHGEGEVAQSTQFVRVDLGRPRRQGHVESVLR